MKMKSLIYGVLIGTITHSEAVKVAISDQYKHDLIPRTTEQKQEQQTAEEMAIYEYDHPTTPEKRAEVNAKLKEMRVIEG